MSSRITLDGNRTSIASKKLWPLLIFWGFWLALWAVGGVAVFYEFIHEKSGPPLGIFAVFLIGWAVAGLCVAFFWLWFAFGKEVITISESELMLRNEILRRGRSKAFPLERVTNLRASGLFGSFFMWSGMLKLYGLSGGMIAFECDGRTRKFGKMLEENEVLKIVNQLQSRIRQFSPAQTTNRTP